MKSQKIFVATAAVVASLSCAADLQEVSYE